MTALAFTSDTLDSTSGRLTSSYQQHSGYVRIRGNLSLSSPTSSMGSPQVKFSQIRTLSFVSPALRSSSSTRLRTLALTFASSRGGFVGSRWMRTRFGMNAERISRSSGVLDGVPVYMSYVPCQRSGGVVGGEFVYLHVSSVG